MARTATSFRVGRVQGYQRGKVWHLCYFEQGQRKHPGKQGSLGFINPDIGKFFPLEPVFHLPAEWNFGYLVASGFRWVRRGGWGCRHGRI